MLYINIATAVVFSLIAIGFLIGFLRNWKKSLIRGCMILGGLIVAILLSPTISSWLIDKFIEGTSFVGFGQNIDLENIIRGVVGDGQFANDLLSSTNTTTDLTIAIINVVMNIVAFLAIFIVLYLITLIVYWIILFILFCVKRKKDKKQVEKNATYWWLKVLGGGIGLISSCLICFVLLTPVFGVMNVCDKFIETSETKQSASAFNTNSLMCGEMYRTEDETIGQFEEYIQKYADIKNDYEKSFLGGFLKITGMNSAGKATFNHLTNVNSNGLKLNVTNELVALVKVYNTYKKNFVENEFDLANNDSLDGLLEIYDLANDSEIVNNYIEEFIPKFCERWINGEKFLGISMPIKGDLKPVAIEVLKIFNTTNTTRLKSNVVAIVGMIKVANNNNVIVDIRNGSDLFEILSNNDVLVKQEVLQLSTTPELKQASPKIIQEFIEIAYKEIVGDSESFDEYNLTIQEIDAINWDIESDAWQGLVSSILDVYTATKDDSSTNVMIEQLPNLGRAIDNSRESAILNKPFKKFIEGFINSDKINLSTDVKSSILSSISGDNSKWDDETYKFETAFTAIAETAKIAQSISSGDGSVNIENLSTVLKEVVTNDGLKDTITTIVNSDAVTELVGNNQSAEILTDMLDTFVSDLQTEEDVDNAIVAGQEIVNIVNDSINGNDFTIAGETQEEKEQKADEILENITKSEAIMDLIDDQNSSIAGVASSLGGDAQILKDRIDGNENISEENKVILNKLFGIA